MSQKPLLYIISFILYSLFTIHYSNPVSAITDPTASANNKFGIHIISASVDEASPAAQLVNSNGGDWGYITVLIERKDRNQGKWQTFFDDLRKRHLIPLVRIATEPNGGNWKRPDEGEEQAWADFLDSLNWPVQNRYVIIYNEPNQGQEWDGVVDPASYAQALDKTITTLKNKHEDFFVLNAGFDASAPLKPPLYMDQAVYMQKMEKAVPGIFNRLDGWVSHSYPNPGFVGSPFATGKGTVRTWLWELNILQSFGVKKQLPVFITETGWKHSQGIDYDPRLPSPERVSQYYQEAFLNAWSNGRIVAVTPFLLNYQHPPFDHFSFKKITGEAQDERVLGLAFPDYYPHYQVLSNLNKTAGKPKQLSKAKLESGSLHPSIVSGQQYEATFTFENNGQSIWGENGPITLRAISGEKELGIWPVQNLSKVEPGQKTDFKINLKAPRRGKYQVKLQLFNGESVFDQNGWDFEVEVKPPVMLQVKAELDWKRNYSGQASIKYDSEGTARNYLLNLDNQGLSQLFEDRSLLPEKEYTFSLNKPYYKPKTVTFKVKSGENMLDFGTIYPDIVPALSRPNELWKLLPFSN